MAREALGVTLGEWFAVALTVLFFGVIGRAAYELYPLLTPCVQRCQFAVGADGIVSLRGDYCCLHQGEIDRAAERAE